MKRSPGLVDDDRAGQVALGEAEPRAVRQRDGRAPPGVVHQVGLGAGGDAGQEPAAGVELRAGRPVDRGRLGLVLLAQLEVASRSHRCRGSRRGGRGPRRRRAVVLDDARRRPGRPRGAGRPARCRSAPARRRRSAPCAGRSRSRCPSRTSSGRSSMLTSRRSRTMIIVSGPRQVRRPEADLAEVGLGDDQVRRRLGVRRVQPVELVAEEAGVERDRLARCGPRARPPGASGW